MPSAGARSTADLERGTDMPSDRTAEQVKNHHIVRMGEELGPLYHALWNELAWLYFKWGEYVEIFGTKPSRLELVNQAAGQFFRIVQDSLWEDSLLHIARLTDRPSSVGRKNLTIRRLPDFLDEEALKKSVTQLIETALEKTAFARDWRNRRIAHKDLDLALKNGAEPLKAASRAKVKEALAAISDALNAISSHYMDSSTMFKGVGTSRGAVSLLYVLDDGLRAEKERSDRLRAGDYSEDDLQGRDL